MTKKINVSGMTCQNCVKHVKSAIESIDGTSNVNVDLENGSATFDALDSVEINDVLKEVNEAGYNASL